MPKIALFLLLSIIANSVFAGFDKGVAAFQQNDYAGAIKEFQKSADAGDAKSQRALGNMYYQGLGVDKDIKLAAEWYLKAANQGDLIAQNDLGSMYEHGDAGEQDYAQAIIWYRKAAEQGDAVSQCALGKLYEKGKGGKQDYVEAVSWYTKAAEQGNDKGQTYLGEMYSYGLGVKQDDAEAVKWYSKASKQGNERATFELEKWNKRKLCRDTATTFLFEEALVCTDEERLRIAAKKAGALAIREDTSYIYDSYDSSALLEGTSKLFIGYVGYFPKKFAKATYQYNSKMDAGKVVEVRNMVSSKYGKPATSKGNPSLGPVTYTWKLKDGIRIEVARDWPDTTVYLSFINPENFAAMSAEQERRKQADENEKRSKQSKDC